MMFITPELQAELDRDYCEEKHAVGQMLFLAVRHGFSLQELTRLAEKYQVSAAWLEQHADHFCVSYATGQGFFHRHFDKNKSDAARFTTAFLFHNMATSTAILTGDYD